MDLFLLYELALFARGMLLNWFGWLSPPDAPLDVSSSDGGKGEVDFLVNFDLA